MMSLSETQALLLYMLLLPVSRYVAHQDLVM